MDAARPLLRLSGKLLGCLLCMPRSEAMPSKLAGVGSPVMPAAAGLSAHTGGLAVANLCKL